MSNDGTLAGLRAELEGIDQEIGRTLSDKLEAQEALARRVEAWDVHTKWLRGERAKIVEAIKVASQKVRGVHRPRPPTDCFNYPEPEKR